VTVAVSTDGGKTAVTGTGVNDVGIHV
jgi:hypothetical protein